MFELLGIFFAVYFRIIHIFILDTCSIFFQCVPSPSEVGAPSPCYGPRQASLAGANFPWGKAVEVPRESRQN